MTTYGETYTRYQLERGWLRRYIRRLYLESAARKLHGPTVDFGCGVGALLSRLPAGSLGLEINPAAVAHCIGRGLDAFEYDGEHDDWSLSILPHGRRFQSLIASHVLEHLIAPMEKLAKLLLACERIGITNVVVIVPGRRGYATDDTHRTFVDLAMLSAPDVVAGTAFVLDSHGYFPGNIRKLGDWFPHHELQVTFRSRNAYPGSAGART